MSCPCTVSIIQETTQIVRGDTATWVMCFELNQQPIEIAGWDIYLVIRNSKQMEESDIVRVVKHTIPASADSALGKAVISFAAVDTADVPPGRYYYEFKRVIPNLSPPDVWTFRSSDKPEFVVKDGYIIYK